MSKTLDLGAVTAYALAVKNGFTGTEAEWLASLKGADGVSPTAENIASALGYTPAKQADVDTLNQNLAKVTHIPVNLPMNLPPVRTVSVDVSFGTTYEKPPIVNIGSLIVVNGSAYPITQNIVGVTTSGVTIQFGNFHQSTTYQANITGYIEVVES